MGRIFRNLTIFGRRRAAVPVEGALIDSGSTFSVMPRDLARRVGGGNLLPVRWDEATQQPVQEDDIPQADGTTIHAIGACPFVTNLEGRSIHDQAWVVETLKDPLIIGAQTLQLGRVHLAFAPPDKRGRPRDRIILDPQDEPSIG